MNRAQQEKVAKTARRKPGNESGLLWSMSAIVVFFLLLFSTPADILDRISMKVNSLLFLILVAAIIGGVIAFAYYRVVNPKIQAAKFKHNENMRVEREKRRRETEAKMADMKVKNVA